MKETLVVLGVCALLAFAAAFWGYRDQVETEADVHRAAEQKRAPAR